MANTLKLPRNGAVGFIDWLGLLRCIGDNLPSKLIPKILEAALANPEVVILSRVALVQHIQTILDHKLRPTECAMIVIPLGIRGIAAIWTMNEGRTGKIFLLSAESPVRGFCHTRA